MDYNLAEARSGRLMEMTRFWLYKAGNEDEQVIWRDTIWSATYGFVPLPYDEDTPGNLTAMHIDHVHISVY